MDKDKVRSILEATLRKGGKTPGLFQLPEALKIKNSIESASDVDSVITLLINSHSSIQKMFGLSDDMIDEGIEKLRELKS